jgi:hypothetical protein
MLPALLRRGARAPLARGAAGAATWVKPQVGLELPQPGDARLRTVTVLPGDGVGPEVIKAAQEAIAATGAPQPPGALMIRRPCAPGLLRSAALPPAQAPGARCACRQLRRGAAQRLREAQGAATLLPRAEAVCA